MDIAVQQKAKSATQSYSRHRHSSIPAVLDWAGLVLSSLCLVHCLALPIFVSFLPLLQIVQEEGPFHLGMAVMIVPLGSVAFWRGYRRHKRKNLLGMGLSGLLLILLGVLLHHEIKNWSVGVTVLGSTLLVFAHWRNWQACRCPVCSRSGEFELGQKSLMVRQ